MFDLTLPLEQVAEGYRAMHERRAIKALLRHEQEILCQKKCEIVEMKKPYVVAHVLSSIDGRIQIHNWPPLNTSRIFESTAEMFKSDAWIVGRTTMQEFSSKEPQQAWEA